MSLRRSQRGRKPAFNVGDVVEIALDSGVSTAQLLHKVGGRDNSNNIRWLVTFDDGEKADEEVFEKSFSRILHSAEEQATTTSSTSATNRLPHNNNTTSSGSSDGETRSMENPSKGEKMNAVPSSKPSSSAKRGPAGKSKVASASGRRKRKRGPNGRGGTMETRITTRSAAKKNQSTEMTTPITTTGLAGGVGIDNIDVHQILRASRQKHKQQHRTTTTTSAACASGAAGGGRGGPRPNKKAGPNEEVIKVKMLTGTLYMYRGPQRRVEFVRFV